MLFSTSHLCSEETSQTPNSNGTDSPVKTKSKKKLISPNRDYEEQLNDLKKKINRDDSGLLIPVISVSAPTTNGSPLKEPLRVTRSLEDTKSTEKEIIPINGLLTGANDRSKISYLYRWISAT